MTDRLLRSALFVPASRPERIPKALASAADRVIVDLEDAVEADAKTAARAHIASFAQAHPGREFLVRVNDAASPWFEDDLAMCRHLPCVAAIVLPKAESADHVRRATAIGKPVIPIIESARGAANLREIAHAQHVDRLSFGHLDFTVDLDLRADSAGAAIVLDHVRCQIVLHSRAAGLHAPLDGVYPDIQDTAGLKHAAGRAKEMGFGGLLCIHPSQIDIIHAALAPSAADIEWAQRVLAEASATGKAAFKLDGKMVDAPVIERARRLILASA
jgi:(S)-citramalyl-CoA lyase